MGRARPVERQRIITTSGATAEDITQLLNELAGVRDFYVKFRQMPLGGKAAIWLRGLSLGLLPLAIPVGVGVWSAFNAVVAAIVSFLGYYLLCAMLVLLCLTRVPGAKVLAFSSSPRIGAFMIAIPAALAAGLFFLVHESVVEAGLQPIAVMLGCMLILLVTTCLWAIVSTKRIVRRIRREQQEAMARIT